MNDSIRPYARTAYAQGWAASGGPITDRVKAGCIAAMDLCSEMWEVPDILEVAIHLGKLEGIWATAFSRRFKLMAEYTDKIRKVWQKAVSDLDLSGELEAYRNALGLTETARDPDWLKRARAEARAAAMRLLGWLPGTGSWQDLRDIVREAIRAARAEGYADALAVAASAEQHISIDFEIPFQHAYDALENDAALWAESDSWLHRMLGKAADEFSMTIGDLAATDASYAQMLRAGMDVLQDTVSDEGTVGFITDWAMSFGMSQGALNLYRSEGVQKVTWMTAGDGRVCQICEAYGEQSPFLISDFPQMPAHPRCRCVASAEFDLSGYASSIG